MKNWQCLLCLWFVVSVSPHNRNQSKTFLKQSSRLVRIFSTFVFLLQNKFSSFQPKPKFQRLHSPHKTTESVYTLISRLECYSSFEMWNHRWNARGCQQFKWSSILFICKEKLRKGGRFGFPIVIASHPKIIHPEAILWSDCHWS